MVSWAWPVLISWNEGLMPRPDLDPATLVDMEACFQEVLTTAPAECQIIIRLCRQDPLVEKTFREITYAGYWLSARLVELDCPDDLRHDISTAHGQRCFGKDPWLAAERCLNDYKAGCPEKPGLELAQRISEENEQKNVHQ